MHFVVMMLLALSPLSADSAYEQLRGTWSGMFSAQGIPRDSMTIELNDEGGNLEGRLRTPVATSFDKVEFNSKSKTFSFEATDKTAGTHYKFQGKLQGTEMSGTLTVGADTYQARLVKWTYVPRMVR